MIDLLIGQHIPDDFLTYILITPPNIPVLLAVCSEFELLGYRAEYVIFGEGEVDLYLEAGGRQGAS